MEERFQPLNLLSQHVHVLLIVLHLVLVLLVVLDGLFELLQAQLQPFRVLGLVFRLFKKRGHFGARR